MRALRVPGPADETEVAVVPYRADPAACGHPPDRVKEEAASVALSWPVMTGLPWCRTRWKDRRCDAY